MTTLKNTVLAEVKNNLVTGDIFSIEDFEILTYDSSTYLLQITFRALPEYSFVLRELSPLGAMGFIYGRSSNSQKRIIQTVESPGDFKTTEEHPHRDIGEAINRIDRWVSNIREDIRSKKFVSPQGKDQNESFEDFYNSIDEHVKDPNSYFTEEEQESLIKRLEQIDQRVKELENQFSISEKNQKLIAEAINKGKADIKIYPKGVWYKTIGVRLYKVLNAAVKAPEARKILYDLARKFLLGP